MRVVDIGEKSVATQGFQRGRKKENDGRGGKVRVLENRQKEVKAQEGKETAVRGKRC